MSHRNEAIVVGVDEVFPTSSSAALRFAAGAALVRNAEIRVVHGCAARSQLRRGGRTDSEQRIRHGRRVARAAARMLRRLTRDAVVVTVVNALSDGVDALLEQSVTAGLVVLQRRSLAPMSRLLAGSTTSVVAARAECPVVVVRADTKAPTGGVVVGMDGRGPAGQVAVVGAAEASSRRLRLIVVHAWDHSPAAVPSLGFAPLAGLDLETAEREAGRFLTTVADELARRHPDLTIDRRLTRGAVVESLLDASRSASLLVVGRHPTANLGSFGLGHVARSLITSARCPVMVVPPGHAAASSTSAATSQPGWDRA